MVIPESYKGLTIGQLAMYASLRHWRKNYKKFCAANSYSANRDQVFLDGTLLPLGPDCCACCKHNDRHGECPIINTPCSYAGCFEEYVSFSARITYQSDIVVVRVSVLAVCNRIEKAITDSGIPLPQKEDKL